MISLGFLWWRIDYGSEACQVLRCRYCNINIFLKSCEFVELMMWHFSSEIHWTFSMSGTYISLLHVNLGSKILINWTQVSRLTSWISAQVSSVRGGDFDLLAAHTFHLAQVMSSLNLPLMVLRLLMFERFAKWKSSYNNCSHYAKNSTTCNPCIHI